MHHQNLRRSRPVLESLEGRRVLSTGAFLPGGAIQAHVHRLAVPRGQSPILANLTPDQTTIEVTAATFSARSKVVTIRGTILAPTTAPVHVAANISVYATQPTSRTNSNSAYSYHDMLITSPTQKTPFTVKFVADRGYFSRCQLNFEINSYFNYYDGTTYYYNSISAKMVLRLRSV